MGCAVLLVGCERAAATGTAFLGDWVAGGEGGWLAADLAFSHSPMLRLTFEAWFEEASGEGTFSMADGETREHVGVFLAGVRERNMVEWGKKGLLEWEKEGSIKLININVYQ